MVHEIIASNLSYDQAVTMGYANLSALARLIQKQLKGRGQTASQEAIVSALKRYQRKKAYEIENPLKVLAQSTISLTTDVIKLIVSRKKIQGLLERLFLANQNVIYLLRMQETATIVLERRAFEDVSREIRLSKNELIEVKKGLTLITIHSPTEILDTAGCVELIYRFISASGINIEDTVSSYTDTLIVVKNEDAAAAFNSLNTLLMYSASILKNKNK